MLPCEAVSARTAGSIRWLASSSSSASLPITSRSTGAGTRSTAGRCRAPASCAIREFTSAASGAQTLTGPDTGCREQECKGAGHVRQRDPRPVLPAVAQRSADAQAQQRQQPAQRAAGTAQHDAGAGGDHPDAGGSLVRGRLPVDADPGQDAAAGGRVLAQHRGPGVAVVAGRRLAEEDRGRRVQCAPSPPPGSGWRPAGSCAVR